MAGTLLPVARQQFLDANGDPYAGGKVYIFEAGTVTPQTVYTDVELTVAHAHPIILNSAGRTDDGIYLDAVSVKLRLDDANDVTIFTQDDVPATQVSTTGLFQTTFFFGGSRYVLEDGTAYAGGSAVERLLAGSSVWNIDSANLAGGSFALEAEVLAPLGSTATVALFNLTDAASTAVTGSEVSGTGAADGERVRSGAITFATSGVAKNYGVKARTSDATKPITVWNARIVQIS